MTVPGEGRDLPRLAIDPAQYAAIYAIGDVHGCHDELLALERVIVRDATGRPGRNLIVMLGDYVDRGPASKAVIEHLLAPPPEGFDRVCLRGNHDHVFLAWLDGRGEGRDWRSFGAEETLASYGLTPREISGLWNDRAELSRLAAAVPRSHREFLKGLAVLTLVGPYVFVHAGVRPGRPIERQDDADLMWIREPFLSIGPRLTGLTVIHGHTPFANPSFAEGRIGIDTGCFSTGRLTALRLAEGGAEILAC